MKYLFILSLILLTGCTSKIEGYGITQAEMACKDHGGIHRLLYDVVYWNAVCVDATLIKEVDKLKF